MRLTSDKKVLTLDDEGRRWPLARRGEHEFVSPGDLRRFRFELDDKGIAAPLFVHPRRS
jgi:hypothetical protein